MSAPPRRIIGERRQSQPVPPPWLFDSHWLTGLVRACHPLRLFLCLIGLLASWVAASMVLGLFGPPGPELLGGTHQLSEIMVRLWHHFSDLGPLGRFFFGGLLGGLLGVIWGPSAGWIARAEVLRRLGTRATPEDPGPTTLVSTHFQSLVSLPFFLIVLLGVVGLPSLLAQGVNSYLAFGMGPFLVALALPVLLVLSFIQVVLLLGATSGLIMPAAIAVERTDSFDALSRGYSYLYQRPFSFCGLQGLTLLLSATPVLIVEHLGLPVGVEYILLLVMTLVLGLSIMWTLQPLIYLKLRRLVDEVPEDDLAEEEEAAVPEQEPAPEKNRATDLQPVEEPVAAPAQLTFRTTLWAGRRATPAQLALLLLGTAWAGLLLGLAVLLLGWIARGQFDTNDLNPHGLQRLLEDTAREQPLTLLLLGVGAAALGTLGLIRPLKALARSTTLLLLRGHIGTLRSNLEFARLSRRPGRLAQLVVTAGIQLTLLTLVLAPLGWEGTVTWESLLGVAGVALGLIAFGGFACGSAAEEGLDRPAGDPFSCFLSNLPETLGSFLLALPLGLVRWLGLAILAGLTWWLLCDVVAFGPAERGEWLRWGFDGVFWPRGEGLTWLASVLAGFWFLLLVGSVAVYPLAYLVRWGTACYLRARQRLNQEDATQLHLFPEEETILGQRSKGAG